MNALVVTLRCCGRVIYNSLEVSCAWWSDSWPAGQLVNNKLRPL